MMAARAMNALLRRGRPPPADRGTGSFDREVTIFADGTLQVDPDRRRQYRALVQTTAMADLLCLVDHERYEMVHKTASQLSEDQVFFPLKLAYDMKCLWDDDVVQAALNDPCSPLRHNMTTKYLLDKLFLLFEPLYVPSKADILCTHDPSSSLETVAFVHRECRITVHCVPTAMWAERKIPETVRRPYIAVMPVAVDQYDCDPRLPRVVPRPPPARRVALNPVKLLSAARQVTPCQSTAAESEPSRSPLLPDSRSDGSALGKEGATSPPEPCVPTAACEARVPVVVLGHSRENRHSHNGGDSTSSSEGAAEDGAQRRRRRLKEVPKELTSSDPLVSELLKESLEDTQGNDDKKHGKRKKTHAAKSVVSGGDSPSTTDLKLPVLAAPPPGANAAPAVPFPYTNSLTGTLEHMAELQKTPALSEAAGVCLLLTRTDVLCRKTRETPINCSFPEYQGGAESSAAIEYIKRQFMSKITEENKAKYEVMACNAVDDKEMAADVLPKLLDLALKNAHELHSGPAVSATPDEDVRPKKPEKVHVESKKLKLKSGVSEDQGRRPRMEDTHVMLDEVPREGKDTKDTKVAFYAVYDGHGGTGSAEVARNVLHKYLFEDPGFGEGDVCGALQRSYTRTDADTIALNDRTGATSVTVAIVNKTLYLANVGDSEAVIGVREGKGYVAQLMTKKHIPSDPDERARLTAAGAMILYNRLYGSLAVSRAFGDGEFKEKPYVLSDPHVLTRPLTRSDSVLVIACDGLWDKVSYQEAIDLATEQREHGAQPAEIAKSLSTLTLERGSLDNVTIIVVFLVWS
eukprot:m51a1_g6907 putative protein phosphatase (804) ;mRNA; r:91920-95306